MESLLESEIAARKLAFVFPDMFQSAQSRDQEKPDYAVLTKKVDRIEKNELGKVVLTLLDAGIFEDGNLQGVKIEPKMVTKKIGHEKSRSNWHDTKTWIEYEDVQVLERNVVFTKTRRGEDVFEKDGNIYINVIAIEPGKLDEAVGKSSAPPSRLALPEDKPLVLELNERAKEIKNRLTVKELAANPLGLQKSVLDFELACEHVCGRTGIDQVMPAPAFSKLVATRAGLKYGD
ncbi:MAG: hypothetical protein PHE27_02765 [Alphaproteobacteria bacterium]|nr:hypothetical protein [Alphaproteobacteria bacterium]